MLVPSSAAARCYGHVSHVTPDTAPRGGHLVDKGETAGQAGLQYIWQAWLWPGTA